ncbi:MAG: carboxypeptidase regulatory-like domain-containing protein [Pyrinomonadaceae bacterium]
MRTTRLIVGVGLACLFFGVPAFGQTAGTGAITGTVTDPQGASVSGVEVTIANEATGEKRNAVSQDNGDYAFSQLLPGAYRIEFFKSGFKRAVKAGLRVNVTETSRLDIQLEVGEMTQTVSVTTETELLQSESPALGRVTDEVTVKNLPLVTRNYTQIVTLSPGIAADVTNATALGRGTGGQSGGAFRSNGAFGGDNNFQMNGVQINDLQASGGFSGGIAIPSPDAIQEFKVQTGLYDASFGRNAGSNVNVVTKSGGNAFHGSAFEFFRNDVLNANDFFRNRAGQPRGILRQNLFGGTVGGPIKKDKLLFFFSYQGTRQINGVGGGSTANISSPAFTNDRSRAALGALFAGQRGNVQNQLGGVGPAILADGSNISPQAIALLNLRHPNGGFIIPTPQTVNPALPFDVRGFSAFSEPGTFDEDQFMVNLDLLHTNNSRIYGRFFAADSDLVNPFPPSQTGAPTVPGFPVFIPNKFRNLSLAHIYTIRPTLINQFDFGFHRTEVGNLQQELFTFADIGVNAQGDANQFPVIGAGTMATGGNGQSVRVNQDHYNFQDSVTWIKGRHTFRFGGGYTRSYLDLADFTFFGGIISLSWTDILLGLPGGAFPGTGNGTPFSNIFASIDLPGDLDRSWKVDDGNLYIQDDIKLTPSFTLNVGLRYERLGHLGDSGGRNSGFDISLANPNPPAGGSLAGFTVSNNFPGTIPAGVTQLDNEFGVRGEGQNNFDPRIGFAWRLPNSFLPFTERMVMRGGYGIYHTRATGQAFLQLATARPFAALRQLQGAPNAAATIANPFQPQPVLPGFLPYSPTTALTTSLVVPDYRPPRTQQYNFNIQVDLGHNYLLEAGYVGTRGDNLVFSHSLNQAQLASPANPIRGVTTNTVASIPLRVPIQGFTATGLNAIDSGAISRYNSLQLSLTKRFSGGLQFLAAYTFAHAYSDAAANTTAAGTGGIAGNQNDRSATYGRADFNREHRFVLSYVYDFPSPRQFNSVVNNLLGGWSLAGVTTIQSGVPLSLTGTNAQNAFGITSDRAPLAAGCTHANLVTSGFTISRLGGASGGSGYFNRVCINGLLAVGGAAVWPLIEPGGGRNFGNSGVGIVIGPGQNNSDVAIIKRTPLRFINEAANVEFRTELFNAFNHPQFGNPSTSVSAATFGVISSTSVNPRIIQFGLKLNF